MEADGPAPDGVAFAALGVASEIDAAVAQVRYVDDLITTSPVRCPACITQYVEAAHPGIPLTLEEHATAVPARWLDMLVHGSRLLLHLSMAKPEIAWLVGDAEVPKSFRIARCLGQGMVDRDRLRGHIRSRLGRWSAVRLNRTELVATLGYDMVVMVRAGYPRSLAAKLWADNARDYRDVEVVRLTARRLANWAPQPHPPGRNPGRAAQGGRHAIFSNST